MSVEAYDFPRILPFRPPAPTPRTRPARLFALLKLLYDNPLEAWTEEHFRELIVRARLPFVHAVMINDPNAIKRVLLDNETNYRRGGLQKRMLSAVFRNGLLMTDGEQWRRQRHAVAPMFALRAIQGFAPAMREAAEACVARWAARGDGALIDVAAEMSELTLGVLERTNFCAVFGGDTSAFRQAMREYFDNVGRIDPCDILNLPAFIPRLTQRRSRPALRFFDTAVDSIVAAQHRGLLNDPLEAPRDLLSFLLEARNPPEGQGLSDSEVRANLITLIAAGHETTANALTWALFLLSKAPDWHERIASEAAEMLDRPAHKLAELLIETRAVIDEALRLYPPIVATTRIATGPDELAGEHIEAGTLIVIAPYVLHRHHRLWRQPDLFDPNRFLGEQPQEIDRYAYLPFGAGPHVCLGASFALLEATIVLATIARHFDLGVAPRFDVAPLLRVTLRPRGGLPMIVRRRTEHPIREKAGNAREGW
jgi:cytochrome P450